MIQRLLRAGIVLLSWLSLSGNANSAPTIHISDEQVRTLATSPYWHLLMRYEPARTGSGVRS